MGNWTSSVEDQNKERTDLIANINRTGSELSHTYNTKYLDPDFCNQVTMIQNDDLEQFQKHVVNNRSYSFGYIGDVPETKDAICKSIKTEYQQKKELVNLILNCFKDCSARIDSIAKGPLCRGNPEALERSQCEPPNVWLEQVAPPDAAVPENKEWYDTLNDFHTNFMKNLTVLSKILVDLKRNDAYYSLDRVKEMTRTVTKVSQEVGGDCGKLQRHLLTMPTFTKEEAAVQERNRQVNAQQKNAAKMALSGKGINI
jgi:hypothetical protein